MNRSRNILLWLITAIFLCGAVFVVCVLHLIAGIAAGAVLLLVNILLLCLRPGWMGIWQKKAKTPPAQVENSVPADSFADSGLGPGGPPSEPAGPGFQNPPQQNPGYPPNAGYRPPQAPNAQNFQPQQAPNAQNYRPAPQPTPGYPPAGQRQPVSPGYPPVGHNMPAQGRSPVGQQYAAVPGQRPSGPGTPVAPGHAPGQGMGGRRNYYAEAEAPDAGGFRSPLPQGNNYAPPYAAPNNAAGYPGAMGGPPGFVPELCLVRINANAPLTILIDRPEVVIGRAPTCTHMLPPEASEQVSRRHVSIRYVPAERSYRVVDLETLNGTRLNRQALAPGREYPLRKNDILELADVCFRVEEARPFQRGRGGP